MTTHVANIRIDHAKQVDVTDDKALKTAQQHGVQEPKTINPGDRFHPADLGLTDEQTAQMVARGQIREATAKDPPTKVPPPASASVNETAGSGATRRGTSQVGPPGVDVAASVKPAK